MVVLVLSASMEKAMAACPALLPTLDETTVVVTDDTFFVEKGWIICSDEAPVNERCTLKCADGHYWLSGDFSRQCQANSLWNGADLVCGKYCPSLPADGVGEKGINGKCSGASQGDQCTLACADSSWKDDGAGNADVACQANGDWSPAPLNCVPKETCVELASSANARNAVVTGGTCSKQVYSSGKEGVLPGLTCSHACKPTYWRHVGEGASTLTCGENGQWNDDPFTCEPIPTCPEDLDATASSRNAAKTSGQCSGGMLPSGLEGVLMGKTCVQQCKQDYERQTGDVSRTCQADGTWSGSALVCTPIPTCGEDLAASAAARDAMHKSGSCAGGVKRGTSCTQQCKSDYEKESGDATRTCQNDGSWSGAPLTCKAIPTCGEDLAASAAARDATHQSGSCAGGVKRGTSCTQQCKSDYEKESGDAMRTCQNDGTWSGAPLTCKAIPTCSEDLAASAAARDATHQSGSCAGGVKRGTSCTQQCKSDYEIESGDATRTCQNDGTWSGAPLTCKAIPTCDEDLDASAESRNATTSSGECTGSPLRGKTCTQACKSDAFELLSGDATRTCQNDGTWSGALLTCKAIPTCDEDLDASAESRNATTSSGECTGSPLRGKTCTQACKSDVFELSSGDATRTCQGDGTWSGEPLVCTALPACSDISSSNRNISLAVDGAIVTPLLVKEGAACSRNPIYFEMHETVFACAQACHEHASCKTFSFQSRGVNVGSCIGANSYADCPGGIGSGRIYKGGDGTKSGAVSVPTTEAQARAYCDSLGAGWSYDSYAGIMVCKRSGAGNCHDCDNYRWVALYDGMTDSCKTRTPVVSTKAGHVYSGHSPCNCNSDNFRYCEPMHVHDDESDFDYYALSPAIPCNTNAIEGSVCHVKCNEGFEIASGVGNVVCRENNGILDWDNKVLSCTPIPACPDDLDATADFRNVSSIDGECSGGLLPSGLEGVYENTTCTQACKNDVLYEYASGNSTRTCQEDSTWSGNDLICSPIPTCAEDLDASADSRNVSKVSGECSGGMLSSGLQGVLRGTECTQKCASEHYEYTSGDATRTCQENGTWSGEPLMCSAVPVCSEDLTSSNVLVAYGECSGPVLPSGLQGVLAGTQCTLRCADPSHVAVTGDLVRTCGNDGKWNGTAVNCSLPPVCSIDLSASFDAKNAQLKTQASVSTILLRRNNACVGTYAPLGTFGTISACAKACHEHVSCKSFNFNKKMVCILDFAMA